MVYSGSQIVKGTARCLVVATAMNTELGKIADAMDRKETNNKKGFARTWHRIKVILGLAETTPLQVKYVDSQLRVSSSLMKLCYRLNALAYVLLFASCILALIVVASSKFPVLHAEVI